MAVRKSIPPSPQPFLPPTSPQHAPRPTRQLILPGLPKRRTRHGGDLGIGRRKLQRPFAPGQPLHLVLRSERAQGAWSMLHARHKGWIHLQALKTAHRFGVKLLGFSNVGNHLHLVVRASSRPGLQGFLRTLPGLIARRVTGAGKGKPLGFPPPAEVPHREDRLLRPSTKPRFWDGLVFSRTLGRGRRELRILTEYLQKNLREGLGLPRDLPRGKDIGSVQSILEKRRGSMRVEWGDG